MARFFDAEFLPSVLVFECNISLVLYDISACALPQKIPLARAPFAALKSRRMLGMRLGYLCKEFHSSLLFFVFRQSSKSPEYFHQNSVRCLKNLSMCSTTCLMIFSPCFRFLSSERERRRGTSSSVSQFSRSSPPDFCAVSTRNQLDLMFISRYYEHRRHAAPRSQNCNQSSHMLASACVSLRKSSTMGRVRAPKTFFFLPNSTDTYVPSLFHSLSPSE